MSPATMTDDVETFDFSGKIRAFQSRVATGLISANSDFDFAALLFHRYTRYQRKHWGETYVHSFVTSRIENY